MGTWTSRIAAWSGDVALHDAASQTQLAECEAALGCALPADLAALLRESNGIDDKYGCAIVWPVERVIADNLLFRGDPDFADLYMPFEPLLFFAHTDNGDQFAFVMRNRPSDVFVWDHETDSRNMIAPHLAAFLQGRLTGGIHV